MENSNQGHIEKYRNNNGRPKGSLNKTTKLKEHFLKVFHKLNKNTETSLYTWSKENQTEFYKLVAKLLPKTLEGSLELTAKEPIIIVRPTDTNITSDQNPDK